MGTFDHLIINPILSLLKLNYEYPHAPHISVGNIIAAHGWISKTLNLDFEPPRNVPRGILCIVLRELHRNVKYWLSIGGVWLPGMCDEMVAGWMERFVRTIGQFTKEWDREGVSYNGELEVWVANLWWRDRQRGYGSPVGYREPYNSLLLRGFASAAELQAPLEPNYGHGAVNVEPHSSSSQNNIPSQPRPVSPRPNWSPRDATAGTVPRPEYVEDLHNTGNVEPNNYSSPNDIPYPPRPVSPRPNWSPRGATAGTVPRPEYVEDLHNTGNVEPNNYSSPNDIPYPPRPVSPRPNWSPRDASPGAVPRPENVEDLHNTGNVHTRPEKIISCRLDELLNGLKEGLDILSGGDLRGDKILTFRLPASRVVPSIAEMASTGSFNIEGFLSALLDQLERREGGTVGEEEIFNDNNNDYNDNDNDGYSIPNQRAPPPSAEFEEETRADTPQFRAPTPYAWLEDETRAETPQFRAPTPYAWLEDETRAETPQFRAPTPYAWLEDETRAETPQFRAPTPQFRAPTPYAWLGDETRAGVPLSDSASRIEQELDNSSSRDDRPLFLSPGPTPSPDPSVHYEDEWELGTGTADPVVSSHGTPPQGDRVVVKDEPVDHYGLPAVFPPTSIQNRVKTERFTPERPDINTVHQYPQAPVSGHNENTREGGNKRRRAEEYQEENYENTRERGNKRRKREESEKERDGNSGQEQKRLRRSARLAKAECKSRGRR